ncbi:unnamed protein product [Acanthoscelides obtectus]|uniref:Uncharacterized protein n=1 Tax=Acanthoscelides obtectus TaxID=200917 RepID=A0A9P0PHW7_ACAOB|nr:unnamed protein product [Acanthoscelides obtectus]CAK1668728.1 hypothetical protein AOBTE_LOCUS26564 [Acanthoscelides obtectus]
MQTLVPLASDLKLLKDYLMKVAANQVSVLQKVQRRRPGKLQRLPINVYKSAISDEHNQAYKEFSEAITETERILMRSNKRMEIRGKRGRGVPVLISKDVHEHLNLKLECSNVEGIQSEELDRVLRLSPVNSNSSQNSKSNEFAWEKDCATQNLISVKRLPDACGMLNRSRMLQAVGRPTAQSSQEGYAICIWLDPAMGSLVVGSQLGLGLAVLPVPLGIATESKLSFLTDATQPYLLLCTPICRQSFANEVARTVGFQIGVLQLIRNTAVCCKGQGDASTSSTSNSAATSMRVCCSIRGGASTKPPLLVSRHLEQKRHSIKIERAVAVDAGIRILPKTKDDYRRIVRLFREADVPYHTFPLPSERNIHALLRGIPAMFSEQEIKGELEQRGYTPLHIIRFKRSGGAPMPLVVLLLPKIEKSQQLFNEHELLGLAIRVEV